MSKQSVDHRFFEKLEIKFNAFSRKYELWRIIIDTEDKLHPIHWQWIENQCSSKNTLKYFAKRKFPELSKYVEYS